MAIYTIIDNRDIDNKAGNPLSSVVSLSAFSEEMSGLISGDYLDDTIKRRMAWMDLSSLTKISSDLSIVLDEIHLSNMTALSGDIGNIMTNVHLSNMVVLSGDIDNKLKTIHLSTMNQVDSDVYDKIGKYLTDHGYTPGGGGSSTITYKYWNGIYIPPHPGGGSTTRTDIAEICRMEIYPTTFEYTGSALTTEVSVIVESTGNLLIKDTDYELTYIDNVDAGNAKVVASGIGDYTGNLYKPFTITRTLVDIADAVVELDPTSFTYNGSSQIPDITSVKVNGTDLAYETDYTIDSPAVESVNVGEKYIQIRGNGGYTGTHSETYYITKADISDYEEEASLLSDTYEYTGSEVKPTVQGIEGLTKDEDYSVTYYNNDHITDEASVTVTGINNYENSFSINFKIVAPASADEKKLQYATINLSPTSFTYDGTAKTPTVTVTDKVGNTLTENVHYTKTITGNVNAGTDAGRVTINAVEDSGYEGSASATFTIEKANISYSASDSSCNWGSTASINVIVSSPSASSYTIYYKTGSGDWTTENPSFGGTASDVGTHTVYFKIVDDTGNYNSVGTDGSLSKTVTVTSGTLSVSASGSSGNWTETKTISVTSEPTATIAYATSNTGTYPLSTPPSYGGERKTDVGTHTVYYQVSKSGYTTVTGSQTVTITAYDISKATISLSQTSYSLKGFDATKSYNDCKPTVTVKVGSVTMVNGTDYSLTYPTGTVAAGNTVDVSVTIAAKSGGSLTGSTSKGYSVTYNYYPTYYLTGATSPSSVGSVTVSDDGAKRTSTGSYDFTCTATVPDTHTFNGWTVSGSATCSSPSSNPGTVNSTAETSGGATATANLIANATITSISKISGNGTVTDETHYFKDIVTGTLFQAGNYSLNVSPNSRDKTLVCSDQTIKTKSDSEYSSEYGITFTYTTGNEVKNVIVKSGSETGGTWWFDSLDGTKRYYGGNIITIKASGNDVKYHGDSSVYTMVKLAAHNVN